jgi:hypothetical protein
MNAAVRSCVGVCLSKGARIFAIINGYKGLVDGGENIIEMNWRDVQDIMHKGGTVINSARCVLFLLFSSSFVITLLMNNCILHARARAHTHTHTHTPTHVPPTTTTTTTTTTIIIIISTHKHNTNARHADAKSSRSGRAASRQHFTLHSSV